MEEMQELVCHCGRVNTFPVNPQKNGNYIIVCQCGHEHCRVCKDGVVTGIRWDSSKGRVNVKPTQVRYEQRTAQKRPQNDNGFLTRLWLNTVGKTDMQS